jgi:hypothetical protein
VVLVTMQQVVKAIPGDLVSQEGHTQVHVLFQGHTCGLEKVDQAAVDILAKQGPCESCLDNSMIESQAPAHKRATAAASC